MSSTMVNSRVLLLTPPMTQLNTPYPATVFLTGFLKSRGVDVAQEDVSLKLALALFSRDGLSRVNNELRHNELRQRLGAKGRKSRQSESVRCFLGNAEQYLKTIGPVISFLQEKDKTLALRIMGRDFLPEGPRFKYAEELEWAFGQLGIDDLAKHLASLYLDDLADVIRDGIDTRFTLSRYAEKLASSRATFRPLKKELEGPPSLIDQIIDELTEDLYTRHKPSLVGLSLPFPGNVYGGFRIARKLKALDPKLPIVMGGGYVNTELRSLNDPQVFDYVDYISLDDGERPLLCLVEYLEGKRSSKDNLFRTFVRENGRVVFKSDPNERDVGAKEEWLPSYSGLDINSYISVFEMLNPMHRIWSDGRWNKLQLAHGCYWKKCAFCDVSLSYISNYEPSKIDLIIDRIRSMMAETGQSGFHFVDEALPPVLLRALAIQLIERGIVISWWGNIRFEKTFTADLAQLLSRSGCVAMTGGLEVASDRLLKLMNKGVSVAQARAVMQNFSDAGILVHAYLMYGFPTQTEAETIEALEQVRGFFSAGILQSAFWHRFSATAHSEVWRQPERFGIKLCKEPKVSFARNDLAFSDPTPCDHERLGAGLRKAVYNYMHGVGLEKDVRSWF